MKANKTIAQVTSVHSRDDSRIFLKMCSSLKNDYSILFILADGVGDEVIDGINIIDVGKPKSRLYRIFVTPLKIIRVLKNYKIDLVHFHDPELLIFASKFSKLASRVIYDAHEDYEHDIKYKPYLNKFLGIIISACFRVVQYFQFKYIDLVVCATDHIESSLRTQARETLVIRNYPKYSKKSPILPKLLGNSFCYIGGISKSRGIINILDALEILDGSAHLNLCGWFVDDSYKFCVAHPGWNHVSFYGRLNQSELRPILESSICGMTTLHPLETYKLSLPIKLFEYLAAGLPVIASNFAYWRKEFLNIDLIKFVDPLDSNEIAVKMEEIMNTIDQIKLISPIFQNLAISKFDWEVEYTSLHNAYRNLLK
jgi:glycosyltransferase involved in cell wall biosynthesis